MRVLVKVSPQFDLCFAVAGLIADEPQLTEWFGAEITGAEWMAEARGFGQAFWLALPDVLGDAEPVDTVTDLLSAFEAVRAEKFVERLRLGLFHNDDGRKMSTRKREWLHYVGIDESEGEDATSRALRRAAPNLQSRSLAVLRAFATHFEATWQLLVPQLWASAEIAERLARVCTLRELTQQLLLRVEVDSGECIRALRGGYTISAAEVDRLWLLPSAFNTRRFWTAADERHPATLYFPYYDPAITLPGALQPATVPAEFDPWLVCRALADPTRAAVVRQLAKRPQAAASLTAVLKISKATMSHHVFHLREAGLINEEREGRSVILSLRREAIANLTPALMRELGPHAEG